MEDRNKAELEIKKEQPLEEKTDEEVVPVEPSPEERIKELESELQETKDKYLRLYAEFENYRRRVQKDKEELMKYGTEPLISELLTVVDNLEMALEHASKESNLESLLKGVEITLKEFRKVLNKFGVKEIEALGKPFDPSVHHAMSQVVRDDVADKTVVEEYRKGYKLNDRVIRPSLVAVSKKPDEEEIQKEDSLEESRDGDVPVKNNEEKEER